VTILNDIVRFLGGCITSLWSRKTSYTGLLCNCVVATYLKVVIKIC